MCMLDDGEGWTLFREEKRRAVKDHRCYECDRTITKGERYSYSTGLFEGYWSTHRLCAHCDQASRWLGVACGGFLYGAVEMDLAEHVVGDEDYLRSAPLTRLVRWMRAGWRDREGTLRPVEDVRAVTDRAIDAYRKQYAKAVA